MAMTGLDPSLAPDLDATTAADGGWALATEMLVRSRRRERALSDQRLPQMDIVRMVDCEKRHGSTADYGTSHEGCTFPREVLDPQIASRVKQTNELSRFRIEARDVRSFMGITSIAAQTQIVGFRRSAVLHCDDVVDGEREKRVLVLMDKAILAAVARPLSDEPPQGCIH